MSSVTVVVPAAHVAELRRTLISLYGTEAEVVRQQAEEALEGHSLSPLLEHRAELLRLDALIGQLGWGSSEGVAREQELSGDRRLLSAAVYGVLFDLCERVAQACQRTWLGEADTRDIREAAEGVLELLPLAAALGEGRRTSPSASRRNRDGSP